MEIQFSPTLLQNYKFITFTCKRNGFSLPLHVNVMDFRYVITFKCKGNGFHEFFYFENQFHEILQFRRGFYASLLGLVYIIFLVIAMLYIAMSNSSLFINKRFALNEMFQRNASKFMYKKTHVVFFIFHFVQLYIVTL